MCVCSHPVSESLAQLSLQHVPPVPPLHLRRVVSLCQFGDFLLGPHKLGEVVSHLVHTKPRANEMTIKEKKEIETCLTLVCG